MTSFAYPRSKQDRLDAMARAERIDAIETEIRARAPRPAARVHVTLVNLQARTAFQVRMRLAGRRDDVLDFAAALYDEIRGMVRPDGTLPLAVEAIESESTEHIQLVLSRDLYEG